MEKKSLKSMRGVIASMDLNRDYALWEQFFMSIGMGWIVMLVENIRVFNKVKNSPGTRVSTNNVTHVEEFPLARNDYEE